jgi:hypothetical protein
MLRTAKTIGGDLRVSASAPGTTLKLLLPAGSTWTHPREPARLASSPDRENA